MEFRKIPMLHNLYEISADGKHFRRVSTGRELKVHDGASQGYSIVVFTINKRYPEESVLRTSSRAHLCGVHADGSPVHQMTLKVHQLVYDAWVGPVPDGMVIDHIDRNRSNNSVDNLRAVSPLANAGNTEHRIPHSWGVCKVLMPNGDEFYCESKDKAIHVLAGLTGKSYRTVYNAIYSFGQYKGFRLEQQNR